MTTTEGCASEAEVIIYGILGYFGVRGSLLR